MKVFMVTLGVATLLYCLFSFTGAVPGRQKRTIAFEYCPENKTLEDCRAYVREKSKSECVWASISGEPHTIQWQSCGRWECIENSRLVPDDLSKPYPDCCAHCETVDPSKPVKTLGVL